MNDDILPSKKKPALETCPRAAFRGGAEGSWKLWVMVAACGVLFTSTLAFGVLYATYDTSPFYDQGYYQGYDAGLVVGYDSGNSSGYNSGFLAGYANATTDITVNHPGVDSRNKSFFWSLYIAVFNETGPTGSLFDVGRSGAPYFDYTNYTISLGVAAHPGIYFSRLYWGYWGAESGTIIVGRMLPVGHDYTIWLYEDSVGSMDFILWQDGEEIELSSLPSS